MSCLGVYTFSKLGMVWQGWEGLKRSVSTHVALAGCVGPVAEVTTSGAPCEAIRLGWSACHTIPPVSRSSLRCNSKLPGINYINLQGVQTLVPWRGIPFTLQKTNINNYRLDDTEQKNHLQILIVFRGNHWFPYLGFSACANRPVDLALMVTPAQWWTRTSSYSCDHRQKVFKNNATWDVISKGVYAMNYHGWWVCFTIPGYSLSKWVQPHSSIRTAKRWFQARCGCALWKLHLCGDVFGFAPRMLGRGTWVWPQMPHTKKTKWCQEIMIMHWILG